ncbi:MAG: hypothetical protein HYY56_03220, partial [Candidatus Omnitrophica bacterium]|nr:hypothetical protein [Candidatus Omnitrophota bacterium]
MIVNENIFRDVLRLFVWFPFRWLVLKVPVSCGIALLRAMGDIHYSFSRGKRELLRNNLSRLKGYSIADDEKCEKSVREYFRNHYIDHLFIFIFPRFGIREIEKFIKIEGLEFLDKALKRGKGVLLIHGHFGPVHLPLVVLARLGYISSGSPFSREARPGCLSSWTGSTDPIIEPTSRSISGESFC